MSDNAPLIHRALAPRDPFQNTQPAMKCIKRLYGHEVSRRFAVLSDEHGRLVGLDVSDDLGGFALERGDKFGPHAVIL